MMKSDMDDQNQAPVFPLSVSQKPPEPPFVSGSIGGKEIEGGSLAIQSSELPIQDMGKEVDLPKEVAAAGVKQHSTYVPIPPPVVSLGVQQTAPTIPLSTGATITLPLSQIQVTEGLQKNVVYSWRWLAEWCIKRLKQMRLLHAV